MFCFDYIILLLGLLTFESRPVLSCAGSRIPRKTNFDDDSVYAEKRRSPNKFDEPDPVPRKFWIDPQKLNFVDSYCSDAWSVNLRTDVIAYICTSLVLSALCLEVLFYYCFGSTPSRRLPVLYQIACTAGWLIFVIMAPLFYWPELEPIYQEIMNGREPHPTEITVTREPTPPIVSCSRAVMTRMRQQRDKYVQTSQRDKSVQTSGPSNKKFIKQATQYAMTVKGCKHERTAKLKRTARMLQQFRSKWKGYIDDMYTKNKLIEDAVAETLKLERRVVILHDACASLREQLKSQQMVNKGVLQRYQDMHRQVLNYLGADAQPVKYGYQEESSGI